MKLNKNIESILIPGPIGQLEITITKQNNHLGKLGIVCHPHPLYEGTMNNKVVTTIANAFAELGLSTIKFNFRGVGASTGSYGNVLGEIQDLLAVINWSKTNFEIKSLWLSGFSFGSYIAAAVANQMNIDQLVSIAPPVNHFPFDELTKIKCPWLVLQGMEDEVVPFDLVQTWAKNPPSPLKFMALPGVGHYFHGKLTELKSILITELK